MDRDFDDLRFAIDRLRMITRVMRMYSLTTLCCTMATIASLIFYPLISGSPVYRMQVIAVAMSAFFALVMLSIFEMRRKEGNALFEEISDDLQWRVAASRSDVRSAEKGQATSPAAREKPGIEARLILRSFTQACDLPLVPGAFGPAVYAILNLVFVILSFFLPRLSLF